MRSAREKHEKKIAIVDESELCMTVYQKGSDGSNAPLIGREAEDRLLYSECIADEMEASNEHRRGPRRATVRSQVSLCVCT